MKFHCTDTVGYDREKNILAEITLCLCDYIIDLANGTIWWLVMIFLICVEGMYPLCATTLRFQTFIQRRDS